MALVESNLQISSNTIELIEFNVAPTKQNQTLEQQRPILYGVNVAKVREVIRLPPIVACLNGQSEVLGVFNLRGIPTPAIHLAKILGYEEESVAQTSQVIVMEFSKKIAGFIVAGTQRIRRIHEDKIFPPASESLNMMTGMASIENGDFIFIVDFEKIFMDIEYKGPYLKAQNSF